MAKRVVKWSLDNFILKLSKVTEDTKAPIVVEAEFDLTKLFPNIAELTDVQRQLVIFGTKQKLMDTGADVAQAGGKILAAKEKWEELVAGKWTGERTNATGASENKKLAGDVKEVMKVVSLESLVMKKALYPATFTAEDQTKLDELMAAAVEYTAKNGKKKNHKA